MLDVFFSLMRAVSPFTFSRFIIFTILPFVSLFVCLFVCLLAYLSFVFKESGFFSVFSVASCVYLFSFLVFDEEREREFLCILVCMCACMFHDFLHERDAYERYPFTNLVLTNDFP